MNNFLIRDDIVQVDKAIYAMRYKIAVLKADVKNLKQENEQLKNRPDTFYDPLPKKSLIVTGSKAKLDLTINIEKWTTAHFVKLFQELYFKKYNTDFKITGKTWQVYAFRIKQFRDAHIEIQDNNSYKNMTEWLFESKFNKTFIASIPLITSDSMFYQWITTTKSRKQTSAEKFKTIAASVPKTSKDLDDVMRDAF